MHSKPRRLSIRRWNDAIVAFFCAFLWKRLFRDKQHIFPSGKVTLSVINSGSATMPTTTVFCVFSLPWQNRDGRSWISEREAEYDDGEPMSYAKVTIASPGADLPFQSGRSDKNGRFCFFPDAEGQWEVVAEDEMGHRLEVNVPVDDQLTVQRVNNGTDNEPNGLSRTQKAIMGVCIIFWTRLPVFLVERQRRLESLKIMSNTMVFSDFVSFRSATRMNSPEGDRAAHLNLLGFLCWTGYAAIPLLLPLLSSLVVLTMAVGRASGKIVDLDKAQGLDGNDQSHLLSRDIFTSAI
jgi:nickel transport protein